jgi:hypothetical protein
MFSSTWWMRHVLLVPELRRPQALLHGEHLLLRLGDFAQGFLQVEAQAVHLLVGLGRRVLHRAAHAAHAHGGATLGLFQGALRRLHLVLRGLELVHEAAVHGAQGLEGGLVQAKLVAGLREQLARGLELLALFVALRFQGHVGVAQVRLHLLQRQLLALPVGLGLLPLRARALLELAQLPRRAVQSGLQLVFKRHLARQLRPQIGPLVVEPP